MQKPSKKKLIQFYEKMVTIRRVEEKLMEVFSNADDVIKAVKKTLERTF